MNLCKTKGVLGSWKLWFSYINENFKIVKILACFRQIFDFELRGKRSQAERSQAENPLARALAWASSARTHHYYLDVDQFIVHCSAYLLQLTRTWSTSTQYNEVSLTSKSSVMDFMKLFACHYQEEKKYWHIYCCFVIMLKLWSLKMCYAVWSFMIYVQLPFIQFLHFHDLFKREEFIIN